MTPVLSLPTMNPYLLVGAVLSFVAGFLHILCVVGGPNYFRVFGAGDSFARLAETGSWIPGVETLMIAGVLMVWGVYALVGAATPNGAGVPMTLPFLKWILVAITTVYLLRGLVLLPMYVFVPQHVNAFVVWSSVICLGYGVIHAIGLHQIWARLI